MLVIMRWIAQTEMWHMLDRRGKFIEQFHDCNNFNCLFEELDKNIDNVYVISAERQTDARR